MQVSKWGNSLAVRIPASVVEALNLKEGDDVEIVVTDERTLAVQHDKRREEALAHLRSANWEVPPGWRFNREEANER